LQIPLQIATKASAFLHIRYRSEDPNTRLKISSGIKPSHAGNERYEWHHFCGAQGLLHLPRMIRSANVTSLFRSDWPGKIDLRRSITLD